LVEEMNLERLEERSGHMRKNCFQVNIDAREGKPMEVGKCDVGNDPSSQQFPLDIGARNR
jgi:hypothetical protein